MPPLTWRKRYFWPASGRAIGTGKVYDRCAFTHLKLDWIGVLDPQAWHFKAKRWYFMSKGTGLRGGYTKDGKPDQPALSADSPLDTLWRMMQGDLAKKCLRQDDPAGGGAKSPDITDDGFTWLDRGLDTCYELN